MIILRIFCGFIWLAVSIIYLLLCGLHIKQFKKIRIIIWMLLGIGVLLSRFVFPNIIFLILTGLGVLIYFHWEYMETYNKHINFKSNKVIKFLCSWIFIKDEDTLIIFIFPRFLSCLAIWVLLLFKMRKISAFPIHSGIEIDVESKEDIVSIHL
jgi:hypothetical protein